MQVFVQDGPRTGSLQKAQDLWLLDGAVLEQRGPPLPFDKPIYLKNAARPQFIHPAGGEVDPSTPDPITVRASVVPPQPKDADDMLLLGRGPKGKPRVKRAWN